jgi:Tfp pilus assembly protein FimT
MLVAIIISALVLISTPLFKRTYEDLKLTAQSKDLAGMLEFCRQKAIFERRAYRLTLNKDKRYYQVLAEDEEGLRFRPPESRWGKPIRFTDGIDIRAEKEEIDFSPDGNAASLKIYLTNRQNKGYTISIEPDTGDIGLYDYKKE